MSERPARRPPTDDAAHDAADDAGDSTPAGRLLGVVVVPVLVLATVAAVALPVLAAVVLVALLPGLGELRVSSAWAMAHLLWVVPVLWLVSVVIDPVLRYLWRSMPLWENVVGAGLLWAAAWACLSVFFVQPLGAALAGGLAIAGLLLFTRILEGRTAGDPR